MYIRTCRGRLLLWAVEKRLREPFLRKKSNCINVFCHHIIFVNTQYKNLQ